MAGAGVAKHRAAMHCLDAGIFISKIFEVINHLHPVLCVLIVSFISLAVESYNGSSLRLPRLERRQMGPYLCIAQNDVPPAVSKRVLLNVHCELMNFN